MPYLKRFSVIELFDSDQNLDVEEWVEIEKFGIPKIDNGIFRVRSSNGIDQDAYFCRDQCINVLKMIKSEISYWWDRKNYEPLKYVTHWKSIEKR